MGPRQVAPSDSQGATAPAISGLVSRETAAAGRPPLVIPDATYSGVFRVRLADGTNSDMMNHARAVDTARLWAVTPVRRKPSPAAADAPAASTSYGVVITDSPSSGADRRSYSRRIPMQPARPRDDPEHQSEQPLLIVVEPVGHRGRFRAGLDGRVLVASSRTPFCDAARALLTEGFDAATLMRHAGSATNALTATMGGAAQSTVEEGDRVPYFRRWRPSPRGARHCAKQSPRYSRSRGGKVHRRAYPRERRRGGER
jgi:hypothetical protein